VEVSGRVQGVGFRWFVVERARRLGLSGWVKNRADGKVEIAAAGGREALAQLKSAVSSGPAGAQVEAVNILEAIASDSLPSPFAIVR
jgi:acylphosphatase